MSRWLRDDYTEFATYEEAWEDFQERNACYNSDYFHNYVSYEELLSWAMKQDAFWSDAKMMEYYDRAEQDNFEDNYTEHEEEDEE